MTLVLLHGVGGNGRLWDGVAALSTEPVVAPDLAGLGRAPALPAYDFEDYARDLLARFGPALREGPLRIVGHSLGGAVAIALAAREPGLDVRGVVAVGVKTAWPASDVATLHRIADKGVAWFASEQEAAQRYVQVNGLARALSPAAPGALRGVAQAAGRWRLAADPEVFRVAPAPLDPYVQALGCPLVLASGEADAMAPPASLRKLADLAHAPAVSLPGAGHNAHVEDPGAVLGLLERLTS